MATHDYDNSRREGRWVDPPDMPGQGHGADGPSLDPQSMSPGNSTSPGGRRDTREARAARDARYIAAMAERDQDAQRSPQRGVTQGGQYGGYGADAIGRSTELRSGNGEKGPGTSYGAAGGGRASGSQAYGYERRVQRETEPSSRGPEARGGSAWDPRLGGSGRRSQMAENAQEHGEWDGLQAQGTSSASSDVVGRAGSPSRREDRPERTGSRGSELHGWQALGQPARQFDADYHQWRAEQLRKLDEEYEQWRSERYQKFSEEFNTWRKQRNVRDGSSGYTGVSADVHAQRESREVREHRAMSEPHASAPTAPAEIPDAGSASAFGGPPVRSAGGGGSKSAPPSTSGSNADRQEREGGRSGGILSSLLGSDKNK
jgi:hypothetical protein